MLLTYINGPPGSAAANARSGAGLNTVNDSAASAVPASAPTHLPREAGRVRWVSQADDADDADADDPDEVADDPDEDADGPVFERIESPSPVVVVTTHRRASRDTGTPTVLLRLAPTAFTAPPFSRATR
jgi:hypothetical protein